MNLIPLPTYHYQDERSSILIGPAFYGAGPTDMFKISDTRASEFMQAMKDAEGHFCHNEDCSVHSGVLPKYAHEHPAGPRIEEMFNLICYLAEPKDAVELAFLTIAVCGKAIDEQMQSRRTDFSSIGEAIATALGRGKKESSPEQVVADLLKHTSDGNSQFGLAIDPTAYKLTNSDTPWEGFGITEQQGDVILKTIIQAFSEAASDFSLQKDLATLNVEVFNSLTFTSVAEQNYCSYLLGIYGNKLHMFYSAAETVNVGVKFKA